MSRSLPSTALAAFAALALLVSALGPCPCVLSSSACHRGAEDADGHACCEKPAGVQAVADQCCDMGPEFAVASTDVPDLVPPRTPTSALERVLASEQSISPAAARNHPLPSFDRTTVLLI